MWGKKKLQTFFFLPHYWIGSIFSHLPFFSAVKRIFDLPQAILSVVMYSGAVSLFQPGFGKPSDGFLLYRSGPLRKTSHRRLDVFCMDNRHVWVYIIVQRCTFFSWSFFFFLKKRENIVLCISDPVAIWDQQWSQTCWSQTATVSRDRQRS